MKPKRIFEIVAFLLVIACLWELARCILNPIEPWPTIEGLEKPHGEHFHPPDARAHP